MEVSGLRSRGRSLFLMFLNVAHGAAGENLGKCPTCPSPTDTRDQIRVTQNLEPSLERLTGNAGSNPEPKPFLTANQAP